MSGLKTKETNKSVAEYIESIENETKREDSKVILAYWKRVPEKNLKFGVLT